MAATTEILAPPLPQLVARDVTRERGGWTSWVTTTDHKKIGIMYLVLTFVFFLLGGTEALMGLAIIGFGNMGALSRRNDEPQKASRPFDKERDGCVMGEGCGVVVLETEEHARDFRDCAQRIRAPQDRSGDVARGLARLRAGEDSRRGEDGGDATAEPDGQRE